MDYRRQSNVLFVVIALYTLGALILFSGFAFGYVGTSSVAGSRKDGRIFENIWHVHPLSIKSSNNGYSSRFTIGY
jgi:hypothetical protein